MHWITVFAVLAWLSGCGSCDHGSVSNWGLKQYKASCGAGKPGSRPEVPYRRRGRGMLQGERHKRYLDRVAPRSGSGTSLRLFNNDCRLSGRLSPSRDASGRNKGGFMAFSQALQTSRFNSRYSCSPGAPLMQSSNVPDLCDDLYAACDSCAGSTSCAYIFDQWVK
jgi:hypothetical protein